MNLGGCICMCVCVIHTHIYIYTYIYIVYTHIYIYVYIYVCVCVFVCIICIANIGNSNWPRSTTIAMFKKNRKSLQMSPTINNSHALSVKNSNPPVVIILARQEVAPAPSIGTNGCLMGGYRRQLLKGKILVPLVPLSSLFLICLRVKSIWWSFNWKMAS